MQHLDPTKRHEFVLLADVVKGNMNGDPDGSNLQRTDPDTMQGEATDVCFKRKIRNYVALASDENIYVEHQGIALNDQHRKAYAALGDSAGESERVRRDNARDWMCSHFWDIRMFGAMLATDVNAGQVRGPVKMVFPTTVDEVLPRDITIARSAITNEEDRYRKNDRGEVVSIKETEFGRKTIIPYGLFVARGFYSAHFARQTGVTESDLSLFWDALVNMFEVDRSASKGLQSTRGLYVFTHTNLLGNAPAHKLFDLIRVQRKDGVEVARGFEDYNVFVDESGVPDGVSLKAIVEARSDNLVA
jgi:CRISPR-associated protein Csd2